MTALPASLPQDDDLSEPERVALARLQHPGRREEWVAARRLTKHLVARAELLDEVLPRSLSVLPVGGGGRPRLWIDGTPSTTLDVSLAATGGWVAAALAVQARVGLDLVAPREIPRGRLERYLSADERTLLTSESLRPAELWAMKEAAFKATSTGEPFRPTTLPIESDRGWRCGGCAVLLIPLGQLTLALATPDRDLLRDPQRLFFERRRVTSRV